MTILRLVPDRWADGETSYDRQKEIFEEQLLLAHRLDRPVAVHCVHSFGDMLAVLTKHAKAKTLPPLIQVAQGKRGGGVCARVCVQPGRCLRLSLLMWR